MRFKDEKGRNWIRVFVYDCNAPFYEDYSLNIPAGCKMDYHLSEYRYVDICEDGEWVAEYNHGISSSNISNITAKIDIQDTGNTEVGFDLPIYFDANSPYIPDKGVRMRVAADHAKIFKDGMVQFIKTSVEYSISDALVEFFASGGEEDSPQQINISAPEGHYSLELGSGEAEILQNSNMVRISTEDMIYADFISGNRVSISSNNFADVKLVISDVDNNSNAYSMIRTTLNVGRDPIDIEVVDGKASMAGSSAQNIDLVIETEKGDKTLKDISTGDVKNLVIKDNIIEKFDVDFDTQGGSSVEPIWFVTPGDTVEMPFTQKPNYTFKGWFTEPNGEGEQYTNETPINKNVTLYAYWIKKGSENPENPEKSEDGIEEGDLPPGKTVPNGVWIGGLKKTYPYTGNAIKPDFRVYYGSRRLTKNQDYTVTYTNNKKVGKNAKATVKMKGDFTGSKSGTFEIAKNALSQNNVLGEPIAVAFKKKKKNNNLKPVLTMSGNQLKYTKKDFDIVYLDPKTGQKSDCSEVGNYIVRMKARGSNYEENIEVPLIVTEKPIMSGVKVTPSKKSLPYNGEKQMPEFTLTYKGQEINSGSYSIKETMGDDYVEPGSHTVRFVGNGTDVYGICSFTYKIINKREIGDKYTTISINASELDKQGKVPYKYGGAKPSLTVTYKGKALKAGRDYTVTYKNNKAAGNTAKIILKGKGNYKGTKTVEFSVSQRDLGTMLLNVSDRAESAKEKDYEKTKILFTDNNFKDQKLVKNKDYTAEFTVSTGSVKLSAGETVSVKIKAKPDGNYMGEVQGSFKIIEKNQDLSRSRVTVNGGKPLVYTGKAVTPSGNLVVVKLDGKEVGRDKYDISYYNNVYKGNNAVLMIRGKGEMRGSKSVNFKIRAADVSKDEKLWDGVINYFRLGYSY